MSSGRDEEGFADEGASSLEAAARNEPSHGGVSPSKQPQTEAESDIKGWGFSDPRLRPFVVISIAYLLFTVTDVSAF